MSGNKNSGRKKLKTKSFEIRFMMEGIYKEGLEKRADSFKTGINQYVKWLIMQDLEK